MDLTLIIWFLSAAIFLVFPFLHFIYMTRMAPKSWKLDFRKSYLPSLTVLVPTFNEAEIIKLKLANLSKIKYPKEKLQIVLINDASTDDTLKEMTKFVTNHPSLTVDILNNPKRLGKSKSMNFCIGLYRWCTI